MNERASTVLNGRRERIKRILSEDLESLMPVLSFPLSPDVRRYLREGAEDLYWSDLEWENIFYGLQPEEIERVEAGIRSSS
ncbi:MAG TPA: hypothetical protein EYN99_06920 [Gemmatimonadetes bacterium]|jgi:hypothetical protein|nr:hypothetical protein [Gemmatimonadota bacterium]HIN77290.1 hypothetical protein [Gemmatimonadota bacterium]